EPRAVLVGRPNAGKSTLLNALAGRRRAVVSSVAGTTRDAVSAEIALERGMLVMIDVAGIEEDVFNPETPQSSIERQMRERALRELETADFVLLVQDSSSLEAGMALPREADLVILSKSDLAPEGPVDMALDFGSCVAISSRTGENLDALRRKLDELVFGSAPPVATLALNT